MEDHILSLPKQHRRTFLSLLGLLFIVLVIIDFYVIKDDRVSGYIQEIAGAIVVSLLVVFLIGVFIPQKGVTSEIEQIEPSFITSKFEELLNDTQRWRYKGNFGRYLRGKVLPTLVNRANVDIDVVLINPLDRNLCEKHAAYRTEINAIDKGRDYTADVVALEIIVTVIHCAWYVVAKKFSIDMYLSSVFDPVRIDSNDSAMILTVEDRRRPAFRVPRGHFMYDHFELHLRYARDQARKVDLQGLTHRPTISALTEGDVADFLRRIGMRELCDRITPAKILQSCREVRNPYED